MEIQDQINNYIASLSDGKRADLEFLHSRIIAMFPDKKLWFLDGKDDKGKVVSNPNIGYGALTLNYSGGKTKEFYQVGISTNTTGISVYIMGIKDKSYLQRTYGDVIGKASITGYCIKFSTLKNINFDVLTAIISDVVKNV